MARLTGSRCTGSWGSTGWGVASGGNSRVQSSCSPISGDNYCCTTTFINNQTGRGDLADQFAAQNAAFTSRQQDGGEAAPGSPGSSGTSITDKIEDAVGAVTQGFMSAFETNATDQTAFWSQLDQQGQTGASGKGGETYDAGGGLVPQEAGIGPDLPPVSWFTTNWPYLALGGVVVAGIAATMYFVGQNKPRGGM